MLDAFSGRERRSKRRLLIPTIGARYRLLHSAARLVDRDFEALVLDLGEDGICLLADRNFAASTFLVINFTIVNARAEKTKRRRDVKVVGEVKYSIALPNNEYRLGINFNKIDEKDKEAIRFLLKAIDQP